MNTRSVGTAVVVALISSCNCDDRGPADAGGLPLENKPPVAVAGATQRVLPATLVTLDGRGSSDPDGDPLTFAWSLVSQPDGGGAALTGATTAQPTFTPSRPGDYVAQLVVNDGQLNSAASSVVITALNRPPVANAGPAQTVVVGDLVTLDGTASQDPDGDPLTYRWSVDAGLRDGGALVLADPTSPHPSFFPELPGPVVVQLVVDDGQARSAPAEVLVTVLPLNHPPVANAGPAQTVVVGDLVTLDGTASQDPDGDPLTYQWSVDAGLRDGGALVLADPTSPHPSFFPELPGPVVVQLVVDDGQARSTPAEVLVTVRPPNRPPVARALATAVLPIGTVTLDGTTSTDDDADPLTYSWAILARPDGGSAALVDPRAPTATLAVTTPGTYVVGLAVADADAGSQAQVSVRFGLPCRALLELGLHDGGSGVYASQLGAPAGSTHPVLCDDFSSADGGWTLLYKKSAGVVGNSYQLWLADGGANVDNAALLTRARTSADYVSPFISNGWPVVEEARVEVVTDAGVVRELHFDARGSTTTSWFAPDRHTSASWSDLPTDPRWQSATGHYFSIAGSGARTWYLNQTWPGCPGDLGWMMITHATACPAWEGSSPDAPSEILYGPNATISNVPNTFRRADGLLVFAR